MHIFVTPYPDPFMSTPIPKPGGGVGNEIFFLQKMFMCILKHVNNQQYSLQGMGGGGWDVENIFLKHL